MPAAWEILDLLDFPDAIIHQKEILEIGKEFSDVVNYWYFIVGQHERLKPIQIREIVERLKEIVAQIYGLKIILN